MKNRFLIILLCLGIAGCGIFSKNKRLLMEKDNEIKKLQELLKEKELLLQGKDLKIQYLRKQLEGLGVFE